MAKEFVRSERKAKGRALRFNTEGQTNVFEITAASSGGTAPRPWARSTSCDRSSSVSGCST